MRGNETVSTDVQDFDSDGNWIKPAGAVRVHVTLKGGTGGGSKPGGGGGDGGDSTQVAATGLFAGGGGAAGGFGYMVNASFPGAAMPERYQAGAGGEGATVEDVYAADALPDQMRIKVGAGGFAHIVTDLAE